jgi:hypothetical protein
MEKVGYVTKKPFATGSKSERDAVFLVTGDREFVLGRRGGNPFHDDVLDQLVGKKIRGQGIEHSYKFILSDWEEVD